jgi:hypothetical protein
MHPGQAAKATIFCALHQRQGAFVIPNPWDAGTARILVALGFEALATTRAGLAFSLGRRDAEGAISREETPALPAGGKFVPPASLLSWPLPGRFNAGWLLVLGRGPIMAEARYAVRVWCTGQRPVVRPP